MVSRLQNNGFHAKQDAFGYFYLSNSLYRDESINSKIVDVEEQPKQVDKFSREISGASINYDVYNISAAGVGGSYRAHLNGLQLIGPASYTKKQNADLNKFKGELGMGDGGNEGGVDLGIVVDREKYEGLGDRDFNGINIAGKLNLPYLENNKVYQPLELRNDFEFHPVEENYYNSLQNNNLAMIQLNGKVQFRIQNRFRDKIITKKNWFDKNEVAGETKIINQIIKEKRESKQQVVTKLTAVQANKVSMQPKLKSYRFNSNLEPIISVDNKPIYDEINRTSEYRKGHHISEFTVLQPDGSRYYFGTPVYNIKQIEYEFNVSEHLLDGQGSNNTANSYTYKNRTVNYTQRDVFTPAENDNWQNHINEMNKKGITEHIKRTELPAYASTYLLNAVLSSDYVDKTNNGLSEDDLGNYVQFNYSRHGRTANEANGVFFTPFKWRSLQSVIGGRADLNLGVQADDQDDQGYFTYGEKELWYMHSIETKEQIAFFYLGKRYDGYAAANWNGGIDWNKTMYYLKKVEVYNKNEFNKQGFAAAPLKVVHLEYDYTLCKNYTNNVNNAGTNATEGGKLTLRKVWFTYGRLGVPTAAPYTFNYGKNPDYQYKAVDKWGTYFPQATGNNFGLNSKSTQDYPYTQQREDNLPNNNNIPIDYSDAWMLNEINLPSGGKINIEYEPDDYAYVQDKQAMQMLKIRGISDNKNSINPTEGDINELYTAKDKFKISGKLGKDMMSASRLFLLIDLPPNTITQDLIKPNEMLYYNFNVKLGANINKNSYDPETTFESITGFAEVEEVGQIASNSAIGFIKLKHEMASIFSVNPIFRMAIQQGLQKVPHLFYPFSDLRRNQNKNITKVVGASLSCIPEIGKMLLSKIKFFQMENLCREVNLEKSLIRVRKADYHKLGGGHRVKQVTVTDNWNSAVSDEENANYTITYNYNLADGKSSGVASYEPFVGGDENPWRYPKNSDESNSKSSRTIKELRSLGPQTISFDLDPVGEQFYPSAIVGYSQVTIRTLYPNSQIKKHKTGYTMNEYYTAKDFPTSSNRTNLEKRQTRLNGPSFSKNITSEKKGWEISGKNNNIWNLGISTNLNYSIVSQGFVIETNDMHGKLKAQLVYTEGSAEPFSGSRYFYKQDGNQLVNKINIINKDETVKEVDAGLNIEPILFGSQYTHTTHQIDGKLDADRKVVATPNDLFSVFYHLGYNLQRETSKIISLTKIVRRNGLIDKVVVYDKGNATETTNLAWDPETGNVLLSVHQNEHHDNVYSYTKPAHWMYKGLEPAYKNIDALVRLEITGGQTTNANGILAEGDELVNQKVGEDPNASAERFWVYKANGTASQIITANGEPVPNGTYDLMIVRSGKRNIMGLAAETIVTYTNPIVNNKIQIDASKVLTGKGITYKDQRQVYEKDKFCWAASCKEPGDRVLLERFNCEESNFTEFIPNMPFLPGSVYSAPTSSGYQQNTVVNPFLAGIRGVWKTSEDYNYFDKRDGKDLRTQPAGARADANQTDMRNDGFLADYVQFWQYHDNIWKPYTTQSTANPWTWSGTLDAVDDRGNASQGEDVLNTHNCAQTGYGDRKLTMATCNNATLNEIMFDGFEEIPLDANINFNCFNFNITGNLDNQNNYFNTFSNAVWHWPVAQALVGKNNSITNVYAHTGWQSLKIAEGETEIQCGSLVNKNAGFYDSKYNLTYNDFLPHFCPSDNKDYIISYWIKENQSNQFSIELNDFGSASKIVLTDVGKPITVEGWKKFTYKFHVNYNLAAGVKQSFSIKFINKLDVNKPAPADKSVYIDDIRIHPVKADFASYVYDANNYRLMATLDNNNFASLFEYDEEGALIRKKAETERGIFTLQESRNSFKK